MLQGAILLILAYPIILINHSTESGLGLVDVIGMILWIIGFLFEIVGDYQLSQFSKHKKVKGSIMKTGLWKYTRHHNYFGEAALWWGVFMIALSIPWGWTAVVCPVLLTFLLLRVSGVPLLEEKYKVNKEFIEYAKKTNKFIPWFPKQH